MSDVAVQVVGGILLGAGLFCAAVWIGVWLEVRRGSCPQGGCSDPDCDDCRTEWGRSRVTG